MKIVIDIDEEKYEWIKKNNPNADINSIVGAVANGTPYEERPHGECKSCRHRDPEDKKCDCGGQERQGCPFPVSDDYYCKYYEKSGADMRITDELED